MDGKNETTTISNQKIPALKLFKKLYFVTGISVPDLTGALETDKKRTLKCTMVKMALLRVGAKEMAVRTQTYKSICQLFEL